MRRWLMPFAAAIVILAIGYVGLWLWAERELAHGFTQWAATSQASGWKVSSAPPERGRWPFAATLTLPDLSLSGGDEEVPGGLTWHAKQLVIELSLLHPRVVVIKALGAQRLRLSILPDVPYTVDELHADVPLQLGVPPHHLDIQAANLSADMPVERAGALTVAHLDVRVQWAADDAPTEPPFTIAMRAADLVLPKVANWPLGSRVASISGDAALSGQVPRIDGLAQRAAAWRDAGGQLKAQRVAITWGSLNLSGNATIGLDRSLQPTGSGTARVVDPSETLSALVAHGMITRRAALAANAVLALLEHVPESGRSPVVEVPLAIQDRTVTVGNIPLAKLPLVVWPDL